MSLLAKAAAGQVTWMNFYPNDVLELFDLGLGRWHNDYNGKLNAFLPTELGWRLLEDYHANIQEDPDHGDEPER